MYKIWAYPLSFLTMYVVRYRRRVVRTNLVHSFPSKTEQEIRAVERRFYLHFCNVIVEALRFGRYRGSEGLKKLRDSHLITIDRPEEMRDTYGRSNGLMILTSHCGNWEMLGGWFAYAPEGSLGYAEGDIAVVYKRLDSEFWERMMTRRRLGPLQGTEFDGYVESRSILRYALEHKGERKVFVFPTDQYPYRGAARHEVGEFLNQNTLTMCGAAELAHKLGMGVIYQGCECVCKSNGGHGSGGRYRWKFVTICENASEMEPMEIMDRYYGLLQKDIESQPWNWLWTHKRWKNLYDYKRKPKNTEI